MLRLIPLLVGLAAILPGVALAQAGKPVPGAPLIEHQVVDKLGRTITYYASQPTTRVPIMLMIQGSGCGRVIQTQGGNTSSTLFDLTPFAAEGQYLVVAVEKPFTEGTRGNGMAQECGVAFNQDFTAERWLVALQAALGDARKLPNVDPTRTVLLGHSEGAVMASLLAGRDKSITDAIVVSGSGTTQLFDFLALAYQNCFDRSACIADVETQLKAIRTDPDSATKFAWGHPYKRWTSFFALDPGAELLRSRARLYLAIGSADTAVPALSQEVAVARLLVAGRDVTVRRVPDGNHVLSAQGFDFAPLDREYRRALKWLAERPAD